MYVLEDARCWTFCFRTLESKPPHPDVYLLFLFHHHFYFGQQAGVERASLPFLSFV